MTIELLLPASAAKPGLLRGLHSYDRFVAELEAASGETVVIREMPLGEIAPHGPALVHAIGDLAPLANRAGSAPFRQTVFLGAKAENVEPLLNAFSPAGVVELHALSLWQQGRPLDNSSPGIVVQAQFFDSKHPGAPRAGAVYGDAAPNGETLSLYLADYFRWLTAR